jgi:hypothetical protein
MKHVLGFKRLSWVISWLLAVGLLLAFTAAACLPAPFPTPTPTPVIERVATRKLATPTPTSTWTLVPLSTPTQVMPTATPTPTTVPSATPTQLAAPTATPMDTPTATPTLTSEPTATPTQVVAPTATPIAAVVGWHGEYYDNPDLWGNPALVRDDITLGFEWQEDAPAPELPADGFSVRWSQVATFEEGLYDFHATMDDGMRVYVDDELLIDEWRDKAEREVTANRYMSAGSHTLRVEYYERAHRALANLWWEKQGSYSGWKGIYWANRDLLGNPALIRDDPQVSFDWQMDGPGGEVPNDHFSARWTRAMTFEEGTYDFRVLVDDGARLWVDSELIVDAWYDHALHELSAQHVIAGVGEHTIKVEYYDSVFVATIDVSWESIGPPSYPYWKGEYFANSDLSGDPVLVRSDRSLNFDWEEEAPAPSLPADGFSVRWTREEEFDPGAYRFYFLVDDGVRFYVDDEQILDEWHQAWDETYEVDVDLSGEHDLKVELYEDTGDARIEFDWERIGD